LCTRSTFQAQTALWFTINAPNANALAFYQHQGYTQVGTSYFALGDTQHENHVLLGPDV
jgi:diamine N-acetyltransferase